MKTTLVLTEANRQYLAQHAVGKKGISRLLNDIIQAHRVLGPLHERMEKQADKVDTILNRIGRTS